MKRIATTLGACLLLASTGAYAAAFDWLGDGTDGGWCTVDSWEQAGCPDDSADTATISSKETYWPTLNDDYCIGGLTMSNSSQLTTGNNTLSVDGTFTVSSSSTVSISGSGGGIVEAESVVINGNSTLTATNCTIRTVADFACE
jgi:hypothetical protein